MGQSLSLAKCTCNNTDVKAGIEYDNNNSNSSDQSDDSSSKKSRSNSGYKKPKNK